MPYQPTPGPWAVVNRTSHELQCTFVGVLIGGEVFEVGVVNYGRNIANAHLMAASPDLLAALESAVEQYGKPGGPWSVPDDPGGWLALARAALKKARGET